MHYTIATTVAIIISTDAAYFCAIVATTLYQHALINTYAFNFYTLFHFFYIFDKFKVEYKRNKNAKW